MNGGVYGTVSWSCARVFLCMCVFHIRATLWFQLNLHERTSEKKTKSNSTTKHVYHICHFERSFARSSPLCDRTHTTIIVHEIWPADLTMQANLRRFCQIVFGALGNGRSSRMSNGAPNFTQNRRLLSKSVFDYFTFMCSRVWSP